MGRSRCVAVFAAGLACLLLFACQTGGTPKQSAGPTTKAKAVSGGPAGQKVEATGQKAAGQKAAVRKAGSRPAKAGKAVTAQRRSPGSRPGLKLADLPILRNWRPIPPLRAVLYGTLAVILFAVIGAVSAERLARRRKAT